MIGRAKCIYKVLNGLLPVSHKLTFFEAQEEADKLGLRIDSSRLEALINAQEAVDNQSVLSMFAGAGEEAMVTLLLHLGHDPNEVTDECYFVSSPMCAAAFEGHTRVLQILISSGGDVEGGSDLTKETPLILAASKGHIATCAFLIDVGADVNAVSASQRNALHWAALRGSARLELVELLLSNGLDGQLKDHDGNRPYDLALKPINNYAYPEEVLKLLQSQV